LPLVTHFGSEVSTVRGTQWSWN